MGFDLGSAATTLTKQANKVVSSSGVASGLSTIQSRVADLQKAAANGLTNLGSTTLSGLAGQVPGALGGAVTALQQSLSNIVNLGNINAFIEKASQKIELQNVKLPMPNVLHNYASYNYIWTMSVLDATSCNFPNETYKKGNLGQIIFKSGSSDPDNRVVTAFGKFDFYMDNVNIRGIINLDKDTGNSNATSFSFKIIEPYSMGLFFQSLQIAAKNAGYQNYIDVPILLTLEFKGHLNSVYQGIPGDGLTIERTTKHFPLKLSKVEMKVTGKGAEYDCTAFPWNEKAFTNEYYTLKTDAQISGKTVHELLQTGEHSLQNVINKNLQQKVKDKIVAEADQIVILFPSDLTTGQPPTDGDDSVTSATVNPKESTASGSLDLFGKLGVSIKEGGNGTLIQDEVAMNPIGRASMGFNLYRPGDAPFSKDDVTYDDKTKTFIRGNISINPSEGNLKFTQGSDIQNAINQTILMSDYGRQALKETQTSTTGKIPWWRIETQVYNIPSSANLGKTGRTPKLVIYRVVPYGVDASRFQPVNSVNPKAEKLKEQVVKSYNYIYTGKNYDIINFDIAFKAGFYNALTADANKNNDGTQAAKQSGTANPEVQGKAAAPATGDAPQQGEFPGQQGNDRIKTNTGIGGSGRNTPETMAAREFQNMVVNEGADMVKTTMTILGDPYYLGDSGMGNYTAAPSQFENMNSDYAIDYQTGEVDIAVYFRTPIDLNVQKGAYDFGPTELVQQFSGLYQVTQIENNFSRGKFTQVLTLIRRMGQAASDRALEATGNAPKLLKSTSDVMPPVYATDQSQATGVPYDEEGNLMPGYELNENNDPVWIGVNTAGSSPPNSSTIQNMISNAGKAGTNITNAVGGAINAVKSKLGGLFGG
jgi:hypothetical protein